MTPADHKTILLVEDNGIIALEQKKILQKHGFNVLSAQNGPEAILIIDTFPEIHLILMDINLGGGMDGTEAARRILDRHDLPLLFLSSHTEQEVIENTEQITSYGYVVKNSGERVLIASIKMAFKLFEARTVAKEREKALQQSEHRFRTSVENMLDCYGIYSAVRDGDGLIIDFRVEYVNRAACENNRMAPEDQIGRNVSELFPAHKTAGLFRDYCNVVENGTILKKESHEYVDVFAGTLRAGLYDIQAVKLGDGFVLSWRDVTTRKKAEELLKESEEKFSRAFHHSPTVFAINSSKSERFIDVNLQFLEMTGYTREEVIGKTTGEIGLFPIPDDKNSVMKKIQDNGAARGVEVHLKRKDGKMISGLFGAQRVTIGGEECWLTMMENITDRKQIENELRKRTDELQAILDNIPVMIARFDQNGHIRWVNRLWEQTLGRFPDENCLNALAGADHQDNHEGQNAADPMDTFSGMWRSLKTRACDGRPLYLSWKKVPLSDGSTIAIGIDSTDHKLVEDILKDLLVDR